MSNPLSFLPFGDADTEEEIKRSAESFSYSNRLVQMIELMRDEKSGLLAVILSVQRRRLLELERSESPGLRLCPISALI